MNIKNRKLQVFVSSTFTDLREERQAAVEAILSTGNIPAGMELFAAGDQSQMEVIKEWIRESDVYLLILGGRYGTIDPISGKSYTQLEYEFALEIGKPHFAVVTSEKALNTKVKKHGVEITERGSEKYSQFKRLVTDTMLVEFWDNLEGIKLAIHKSLAKFGKQEELVGWVRGNFAIRSEDLVEELERMGKENSELKLKISETGKLQSGLDFDVMYQNLKKNLIEIIFLKTAFGHLYDKIRAESINANVLLVLIQDSINGLNGFSKDEIETIFPFFSKFNLITVEFRKIKESSGAGRFLLDVDRYFPQFTREGITYLLYLERLYPGIASEYLEFNGQ